MKIFDMKSTFRKHDCARQASVVEFAAIELEGRWVGAYYVDGELVSVLPDVTRL
jgi:hypothetical protein